MAELQNQIGLTSLTTGQLTNKASQLKLMLRNLVPGTADYKKYKEELGQVTDRINELNGKAKAAKLSLIICCAWGIIFCDAYRYCFVYTKNYRCKQ